eukprot:9574-Pelagococcus_subviridis.AAC.1
MTWHTSADAIGSLAGDTIRYDTRGDLIRCGERQREHGDGVERHPRRRRPREILPVEFKGVRGGVERRRGVSGLKANEAWAEPETTSGGKVLKDRRSPRGRVRMGTGAMM